MFVHPVLLFGISVGAEYLQGRQLEFWKEPINKTEMAGKYMPMDMYICKHAVDAHFNVPITAYAIRSLLCQHIDWSWASKCQDQRKPLLVPVYSSNKSPHAMVEPQMISLVRQLRHNMYMYSRLCWFTLVSWQKISTFYQHVPCFYPCLISAFALRPKPFQGLLRVACRMS